MSEQGHTINVANFENLTIFAAGFGAAYEPSQPIITLASLQASLTAAQNAVTDTARKRSAEKIAINARDAEYKDIGKLSTRITNAAAVAVNDEKFSAAVRTIVRRLQGRRAGAKPVDDPATPDIDESVSTRSVSQQSYDNLVANFAELIALLKTRADYAPNETDLKIAALEAKLAAMQTANTAAKIANIAVNNARAARDEILYNEKTGILALANLVKKYVKSVFGADSPQAKQLYALQFRKGK